MISIQRQWSTYPINFSKEESSLIDLDELQKFTANPHIRLIKNAFVTKTGIVLKDFRIKKYSIPLYKGYRRHFYKYALAKCLFDKKLRLEGKYFLVHNHWCPGYYHWITEALPRFMAVKNACGDRKLLIPEYFPSYVFESLSLLGNTSYRAYNGSLVTQDLLLPENTNYTGYYDWENLLKVRGVILDKMNLPKMEINSRLYISRQSAQRRKVTNEEEIVEMLRQKDFDIVQPESYDFLTQVKLFASCNLLVSIHGAGLTNMLFMPKGATVVELQMHSQKSNFNTLFLKLANMLGLNYYMIPSRISGEDKKIYSNNIHVDCRQLRSVLENSLK